MSSINKARLITEVPLIGKFTWGLKFIYESDDFCFTLIKATLSPPLNRLFNELEMKNMKSWIDYAMFQNRKNELSSGFEALKRQLVDKSYAEYSKLVFHRPNNRMLKSCKGSVYKRCKM